MSGGSGEEAGRQAQCKWELHELNSLSSFLTNRRIERVDDEKRSVQTTSRGSFKLSLVGGTGMFIFVTHRSDNAFTMPKNFSIIYK